MQQYSTVIGMDLGDKTSHYAVMNREDAEVQSTGTVRTTESNLRKVFAPMEPSCIAIEAGTHSPWVSRLLEQCGHQVTVANPRFTRAIYSNPKKNDRADAEMLARLLRSDPHLLAPVQHKPERQQGHLAIVKARDVLVRVRAKLINAVRGMVKSMGQRLPECSADAFHKAVAKQIPRPLKCALMPLLKQIANLTAQIHAYDKDIATLGTKCYPECHVMQTVTGVGPVTSLSFRLIIGDPYRFRHSRDVPAYFGLTRKTDQSGDHNPELSITKAGDNLMRRLLVQSAQYILGNLNKTDSELRQWGLRLAGPPRLNGRTDPKRRKRAVVAVARKLAVLLHTLWLDGTVYDPFFNQHNTKAKNHAA